MDLINADAFVEGFQFKKWMKMSNSKGQLISKCLFGVFTFFQTTNQNKSTSSKVEFVCSFFGRNVGLKKSFPIFLTFISVLKTNKIIQCILKF
jgi:hypothetical protein